MKVDEAELAAWDGVARERGLTRTGLIRLALRSECEGRSAAPVLSPSDPLPVRAVAFARASHHVKCRCAVCKPPKEMK